MKEAYNKLFGKVAPRTSDEELLEAVLSGGKEHNMDKNTSNKSFESDEHCKAWLIRVAINLSKNLLKSFRYAHTEELDEAIPMESADDCALADALSALPPKYRAVIHLHYFEGYSAKEIAKILGLTVTTVTTRLARARERLKALMTSEENFRNRSNARMRRDTHERRLQ